ncbi:hypothetical protein EHS13_11975 [Paenibacillus psychroresistens]|uniref:Alpha-L-rhamnosidase n=1 Tax=Paenibacillus psychroresistens TaxID=1778678 RepID=A0A6B8RJH5_9BACL|nr:alpha-L-rhamnosidase C-terminal domain-containing protein [Paenibacillus psychroresistens]QGQ95546.1 hypothetical protein EHS13_11975 [Paenibacillus psychroresistens]
MEENYSWKAKWIWAAPDKKADYAKKIEMVYFRRSFELEEINQARLLIRISADSRYRLFINGIAVSAGPCKGDENTHYYETVDVTEYLQAGLNVLAAQVIHYAFDLTGGAESGPISVRRSDQGGFFLEGSLVDSAGDVMEALNSNEAWQVLRLDSDGMKLHKETFTLFIGGGENVDGSKLPHGWEQADYDAGEWGLAVVVADAYDSMYGQLSRWLLTPRAIPLMGESKQVFAGIVRGAIGDKNWEQGKDISALQELTLLPGESLWLELDAGKFTSGYPRLEWFGGAGASINLLYAECYEYPSGPDGRRNKGVRDEYEGKALYGFYDDYLAAGYGSQALQSPEIYEPFHRRAFRYIRLSIQAGAEPLTLGDVTFRHTGYPLQVTADFDCSDPSFAQLWEVSINTLRNCMHETYEDTPYYEQMQYEMDTRLQALFTYNISADDRLGRKALFDFHSSLLPTGMLQSRYPAASGLRQVIPGFALFWIMMVHDHYHFFGDASLVVKYRPSMDAVLGWFENKRDHTGLVGKMPEAYWSFVDWVMEWKETAGAPPAGKLGPLTVYNLMYIDSLTKAAELNEKTGRSDTAKEYLLKADEVRRTLRELCWSDNRQLFQDGPGVELYSPHAQIWAVLTETITGEEARQLMQRILESNELPKVSIAFTYYFFRALKMTGLYDQTHKLWDPWREQLDLHLTSWVEDPVSERSDCHAWGALPLFEFPNEVLGVKPFNPGFSEIEISPVVGALTWAKGSVATQYGLVEVDWSIESNRFVIKVKAPNKVPVKVLLPNGESHVFLDREYIELSCSITN